MILLLDNFDSFTYNLVDYFSQLGIESHVVRNSACIDEITTKSYSGIVLSPGPENPDSAGILMEIVDYYVCRLPVLGICLGHQALALHFGASLVKARKPMHGKISRLDEYSGHLFSGLEGPIDVVRYHSLIIEDLPEILNETAICEGELMAFEHKSLPVCGIQFHPEAALTTLGINMLSNWVSFNNIV